jgi:Na+/H+ antiporter NhaD/arsenite permease-like protein
MMLGTTLGGNGTLVGASSNIVAAGIAEQNGKCISFSSFLKYGIPMMALQLVVAAGYIFLRF